ncbi:MAG: hypothetical protein ACYST6_20630 [Planctomycetota bacterium]
MIRQLAKAIKAKFDGNAALSSALTGGLYFQQAEEDPTWPYGVFYLQGGTRDEIMGTAEECVKNADVQFNLFSNLSDGGAEIAELSEKLTDCFNWVSLTIEDYNSVFVSPNGLPIIQFADTIWQATAYYTVGIEKT